MVAQRPFFRGETWLGSIKCLNLALFVDRHAREVRVLGHQVIRMVQIEAQHAFELIPPGVNRREERRADQAPARSGAAPRLSAGRDDSDR
jgi:hypothetical protein